MKLYDTHSHLYLPEFDEDREQLLQSAIQLGVERFYLPNVETRTIEPLLALSSKYPQHCFPMMGLHPCSVNAGFESELKIIEQTFASATFCAIGEIGLDLYWDKTYFEQQKEAFLIQCNWAVEKSLPVVIHTRNSIDEAIALLTEMKIRPAGIFHCFSGTIAQANAILNLGFYLGIGGVVTFKNSGLDKVVEQLDLRKVVLETDAPYLAPVPFRGKRNIPEYILLVAEKIASLKQKSSAEIAEITCVNAEKIFTPTHES